MGSAVWTPARTRCPENLINYYIISKGPTPRSTIVQLHFCCTSASSETRERNSQLSRSPEILCEPIPARSAPPAGSGAAGSAARGASVRRAHPRAAGVAPGASPGQTGTANRLPFQIPADTRVATAAAARAGTRRGPASGGDDNAEALPEHPRGAFVPARGGDPTGPFPRR